MIVLDASAAVRIASDLPEGQRLQRLMLGGEECCAPSIFAAEVCNAFYKYFRAGCMDAAESKARVARAMDLVDRLCGVEHLYQEAYSESLRQGHCVYDMLYLVLARRFDATLFTMDKKLRELCVANGVDTVELYDIDGSECMVRAECKDYEDALEAGWIEPPSD
jgi:predicted nucleic acid-binding protein